MRSQMNYAKGIDGLLKIAKNTENISLDKVQDCVDELKRETKALRAKSSMEFSRAQFDRNLCDRLGIKFNLTDEELDQEFCNNMLIPTPEPGVKNILSELAERGIQMGIISNSILGGKALSGILDQHDMLKYFDFVMTSSDYGFRKPHLQIFKTGIARTGCKKEEIWFAGDWIPQDIVGAKNAGLTSVWYNVKSAVTDMVDPDFEIQHWDQLLKII